MNKFISNQRFMQQLFYDQGIARQAAEIGDAILAAHSLRRTEITVQMRGQSYAS